MNKYLIIKPHVKKGIFLNRFLDNDWMLWGENPRSDVAPYEVVWTSEDELSSIHYIEDHMVNIRYLQIKSEKVDAITDFVQTLFPDELYRSNQIFQMVDKAESPKVQARGLAYLAVSAPSEFDQSYYDLFDQALQSPDIDLRLATLLVLSYVEWAPIKRLVREVSLKDQDKQVREAASTILKSYDEVHPDGTWG